MKHSPKGILNQSCLFKIDALHLKEMSAYSFKKAYQAGDVLFYEGDNPTYLFMLLSGSVSVFKTKSSGTNVILHTLYAGEMIGEFANFGSLPYPGTAQFNVASDVLVIDFERFKTEHLMIHPEIGYAIIQCLIKKQKALMEIIHNELALCAEQKIVKFLLENEVMFPKLKYFQIASILNTAPETLSRLLSKLKHQKLIYLDNKRHLTILDRKSLEDILNIKHHKYTAI